MPASDITINRPKRGGWYDRESSNQLAGGASASQVEFLASGSIGTTNVQDAIDELCSLVIQMQSDISAMQSYVDCNFAMQGNIDSLRNDIAAASNNIEGIQYFDIPVLQGDIGGVQGEIGEIRMNISNLYTQIESMG